MKTKLDCGAGWQAPDLEELTQRSSSRWKAAGKRHNKAGSGGAVMRVMRVAVAVGEVHGSSSRGPQVLEMLSWCAPSFPLWTESTDHVV